MFTILKYLADKIKAVYNWLMYWIGRFLLNLPYFIIGLLVGLGIYVAFPNEKIVTQTVEKPVVKTEYVIKERPTTVYKTRTVYVTKKGQSCPSEKKLEDMELKYLHYKHLADSLSRL